MKNACAEGILAGYKVVDVKIDFYDGKMHPVDSKDIAFQIAGYFAFKESFTESAALPAGADSAPSKSASRKIAWAKSWATFPAGAGRFLGIEADGAFQVDQGASARAGTVSVIRARCAR